MHVIFRDGLEDRDYIERYTIGADPLRERVKDWTPQRAAEVTGLTVGEVEGFAREYATRQPSALRINYGLNRHAGAGMAVRTIACLPALVGAWRHPGGGLLLSTSGTYPVNNEALERPDLVQPGTRTLNMSRIGKLLLDPDLLPPVKALFVYNSNPVAVAPEQESVRKGFAREDLFTVVHDLFQTDTADFADIVLPATTTLEHYDIHKSYGHLYLSLSRPAIAPEGESKPNTEVFRLLAARLGLDHPCLRETDEEMARQALRWDHPHLKGITFDRLEREGSVRLSVPEPFAPFAEGGFPTPSGKCELYSERLAQMGLDPVPTFTPPYEFPERVPALAASYPLTLISSPAHQFLNTTFVNVDALRRAAREPECVLHPNDAERRGIPAGARVVVHNDRGAFTAVARVEETIREGVVWAPSIWWGKYAADGANANQTTSQRETDLGHGPVFYDNLVEVSLAD